MSSVDSVIQDPVRIAAVRELGAINSRLGEPLHQFTRLAASAVDAPVSSISLLDGEREHFVTVHGVPSGDGAVRHCPVQRSICRFTVAGGQPLRLGDLRADPRVEETIVLAGMEVVAYLGVPLRLRSGAVVGSVCVVDERPRDWSEADVTVLTELAGEIVAFLELRSRVLHRVLHDSATEVPGETLFIARCVAARARHAPGRSAMLRIELPGLQPAVSSLRPRREDDDAPREAARRLAEAVGSADILGRLSDGVFAVFADELTDERDALRLAGRIRRALRPERAADGDHRVDSVRIGIALCDAPTESTAELVRRAEHVISTAASHGSCIELATRAA